MKLEKGVHGKQPLSLISTPVFAIVRIYKPAHHYIETVMVMPFQYVQQVRLFARAGRKTALI
ncbi:MAG: hypothetical protein HYX24_01100 [Candidatus Aenigmarchaeota archaeon]|nr:hypothetical protein [Candidatus Aenigmarchaeota archaeon]